MSFPADPLAVVTELFLGGDWVDITDEVLLRDRISITRGRSDEASQVDPSTCNLSIRNTGGIYSPRNPRSPYFGTFGRNTPLRVAVRRERDSFARTVATGWGVPDVGPIWFFTGVGGVVNASDFSVSGGIAVHSVPTTAAFRFTFMRDVSYRDVEVAVSFRLSVSDVTGDAVEPAGIQLRGTSTVSYYLARVEVTAAEAVRLRVFDPAGTELAAFTVPGLTYTAGALYRMRAQIEGGTIRARVWNTAGPEPRDWQLVVTDPNPVMSAGWVGIRSGVAGGNTNTKPVVFQYQNVEVRLPRFTGEVSSWPARWDTSGNDVWVPITASGLGRRLGQGAAPLRSPMFRAMTSAANIPLTVAYWPCEDQQGATQLASVSSAEPLRMSATGVQLADSTDVPGSGALPMFSPGGSLTGDVPVAASGAVFYRQVMAFPRAGTLTDGAVLLSIHTTGTAKRWDLIYIFTAGTPGLNVRAVNAAGDTLHDLGALGVGFPVDGARLKLELEMVQAGANVSMLLVTRQVLADGVTVDGLVFSDTFPAMTVGRVTRVVIAPTGALTDTAIGHIGFGTVQDFGFDMADALVGNAGEPAGTRITRLTTEEDVPATVVGDPTDTTPMGAQGTQTLLALLRECEDSDGGVLYEPRGDLAFSYRPRVSTYNQKTALALDYTAAGEVSPPLEPVDDDQRARNDVTVQRAGGSSARFTLDTGPLSTLPPPDGVGRYDEQVTLSLAGDWQAADQASWRVHLGTWDEARYPTVHVNLAAGSHLIPTAAAVDVRDRLTITNPPPWLPPGTIDLLAEGYTETLGAFGWDIVYNCSPAGPWTVGVLDDPVLGRADTSGSALTAAVTTAGTTLTVATTSGPVWITGSTSPDFPFDVLCGGEVMTVTAITGATSPQTFTVTRGVNGVALAHPAGTAVSLAHPMRAAL